MGFHGNGILRRMVGDLIRTTGITSFVETGTCTGITTEYMASAFPGLPIFSCEINPQYYSQCVLKLQRHTNVKLSPESSEKFIDRLISENALGDLPMFFLDAHWYDYWPLPDEVAAISRLSKFIVLVDDFMVPGQPQFETSAGGGGTIGEHRTKSDSRPCGTQLIGPLLPPDCEVAYPMYGKQEAYGTPHAPHLVGYAIILRGVPDIGEIRKDPFHTWGGIR